MQQISSLSPSARSHGSLSVLYGGVTALILIAVIMAAVTLMQLREQARIRAVTTTQNLAKSIEQTIDGLVDTIDVALLSSSKEISRQMAAGGVEVHSVSLLLMEQQKLVPSVVGFRATDERGDIIYGADTVSPPINIADRDYFIRLRDDASVGLVFTKPFVGRVIQKWVWGFARRISKPDGSFGGVVFAVVSIDEISRLLNKINIGAGGSISLRTGDLALITRYPASSLVDFPIGEKRLSMAFLETFRENPREGTYSSGETSIDGIDRTYSYFRSAKYDFIVNVGADNQLAFAEWRKQARTVGGLVLLFILALLVFSRLISHAWRRQEESLDSLRDAQEVAHLGHYVIELRTGHWTSSTILDGIVGIDSSYPRDARHWQELAAPEYREERQAYFNAVVEQHLPFDHEYRIIRPCDGEERWVHSQGRLQLDADGEPVALVGTILDITERKRAEAELRIAAAAFESQEAMVITDADTVILRVNRAFTESTGYSAEEIIGKKPSQLKSGRHDAEFFRAMWESIKRTGGWQGEIWDRRKDGQEYQKWLTISAVKDGNGVVTHYVGAQYDITERKRAEEKINELAFYDQLTGLPNRTLLLDRLKQAMTAGSRSGKFGALLLIDLDHFKTLNDTLGHDMGDLLLKQVGQRLTACIRAGDTVARLGGDEFVVVLAGLSQNEQEAATATEQVGEKILAALKEVYRLKEVAYHCTPSIGATLFCGQRTELEALLKQGDLAMYKAKDAGRNTLRFFDPDMEVAVMKRAALEKDLRTATEERHFVLHYQAQMSDGRLIGAEALVRWQHPQRGMISPADFIPLAEETGLILPLGQWVMETACKELARWAGKPEMAGLTLAVNVSAQQFRLPDFVSQVLAVLRGSGADPKRLKLELTESMLVDNIQDIVDKMFALKREGVGFSLDDFGTGYSSLSYLKRLPLDQLKIDQSFVRDVLDDANDASIAQTIIALARSLGLGVIAEGVETAQQRDFLASSGCHAYQGYYFSRPLPADCFDQFVLEYGKSGSVANPAA